MRKALNFIIDTIFPPQCDSCGTLLNSNAGLCHKCWSDIDFIEDPKCRICGMPFEYDMGENVLCASCIQKTPPFDKARSVCKYNDVSRKLVTGFKFHDRIHMNNHLAKWMLRISDELLNESDIIIPVPLHRIRLWKRKYNQSALLAMSVSKMSDKPVIYDFLIRKKNTKAQSGLTFAQRQKNVKGAFILNPKYSSIINEKNILIVDDVMTTGATVLACAKILKRSGAKSVNILTFARTLKDL